MNTHTSDLLNLPVAQELQAWIIKFGLDDRLVIPAELLTFNLLDYIFNLSNLVEARDAYFSVLEEQIPAFLESIKDTVWTETDST